MKISSPKELQKLLNKSDAVIYIIFRAEPRKDRFKTNIATIIKPTLDERSAEAFVKAHEHILKYIHQLNQLSLYSDN